jgi:UDP-N-acetylmuramoylalanine--D-glutamate ligase
MLLKGKTVMIVGMGESGTAAADLCLRHGARVVCTDTAPADRVGPEARALADRGAVLELGGHANVAWSEADLVVVSPGVPPLAVFDDLARRGVETIGELELASRFAGAPMVAIGGTNGKSTTTTLVAAMLSAAKKNVFAGANLGVPLSRAVGKTFDVLVLEVSSFQMERAPTFHPRVAALLNVTEDHLDRYASFDAYAAAKGNMFANQVGGDVAVVAAEDPITVREARRGGGQIVTFGFGAADVVIDERKISDRRRGVDYPVADIRLCGSHNMLNAAAAIACAAEAGAIGEAIRATLADFEGLAHRVALVDEIEKVRYYDDSKGTNVGATIAAVRGLSEARVVLIAGGRDKLGAYAPLAQELARKGRAVVVIGEAADRIAGALRGAVETVRASSMDEAVRLASAAARPGDAVLLSPACSSFDMFRDYKHRGEAFVSAVKALRERT